jgi:putative spermidine/putrescine transport system permease protein
LISLQVKKGPLTGLARDLAKSRRAAKYRALLLIAPLLVFQLLVFIVPVSMFLSRSFIDADVARVLPETTLALMNWDASVPVPDAAYGALLKDMQRISSPAELASAATRLNFSLPGMRFLMMRTHAGVQDASADPREVLTQISPKWDDPGPWATIKQASGPVSIFYFLSSLDLKRNFDNSIVNAPLGDSAFRLAIQRTFEISFGVTALTLLVGFPFAYLMAISSKRMASILMIAVLLPFWTAVMVRVLSWLVLLGRQGILNTTLQSMGLTDHPLDLLYNRFGVYVSLVHIFAPFMVLPVYSVMNSVPASQMRAAASLGARPIIAFLRVYIPQVTPGIAAGALLVFIQCLGVFVVPAILGGQNEQGLPMLIAFYVNKSLNWGLAAALSVILLVAVSVLYWLFVKLTKTTTPSVA